MSSAISGLRPVIDTSTVLLILGSMPGEESLRKQQYYARATNDFWKIIGKCIGRMLASMPYEEKISTLLSHNIGLWDVYQYCSRDGSSDASIAGTSLNDFKLLRTEYPAVAKLLFNGKEAGQHADLDGE